MQILSYVLSLLGLICIISASLIKGARMKSILFLVFGANVLIATSYLVDGSGINGAAACYLGGVQALVNYFFDSKNKPIPKWLIAVYAVSFIAVNIWVSGGITAAGTLATLACLVFVLCIGQESGRKYRFWNFVNIAIWCIYDIFTGSYSVLVSHGTQLAFAVVGIFINDRKNKVKTK